MNAACCFLAYNKYGETILEWLLRLLWRLQRLIALASKQNEAGLLLARVFPVFNFILIGEMRERVFVRFPRQPGGIVIIAGILGRLLNRLDLTIELLRLPSSASSY